MCQHVAVLRWANFAISHTDYSIPMRDKVVEVYLGKVYCTECHSWVKVFVDLSTLSPILK